MQKGLKKPKMLQRGDTLAAVTLSWGGPSVFPHRYQAGKNQLEEAFGVRVIEMPHTLSSAEFLHKNPQARADDLMQAFSDPAINGIISTIGGDDSIRLLPYMDLDIITRHPKVFLGFSDTTVSHLMCFNAGVDSFYGPAIMAGFGENGGLLPYMRDSIARVLFSVDPIGEIPQNTDGWTVEMLDWANPVHQSQKRKLTPSTGWHFLQGEGQHSGHLMGGCIEVLDWLRGSPLWPGSAIWKGAVLFLETSEEAPAPQAVARILRAFAAAGVLKEISAVLFGRPGGQVPLDQFAEYDRMLLEIIAGEAGRPDLPIVTGMDFGHTDPTMVLPYGCTCVVDCDQHTLTIPESAVST
jgi:muramoyltetrapeptide carboxypeptidase LdcA involved in peptidoglycan recycling